MQTTAKNVALWFWMGACAIVSGGQQPAALPPSIAAPTDDFSKPPDVPRHRAKVEFSSGQLKVLADNSSLNEILVEVAGRIGMKITGSIPEQRVFGIYGPAEPADVVARLLSGSGSNLLLRENARRMPLELILTPRTGGPSTPSVPSSVAGSGSGTASDDQTDSEDLPPQLMPHVNNPPVQPTQPAALQPGTLPASSPLNPPFGQSNPAGSTTTQQSPNGVKTPQQIYDQLIQLQQKNAPTAPK